MHAVVAADGDEVRPIAIGLLERLDVSLVHRRGVSGGVHVRRHDAEHGVAHPGERVVVRQIARPDDFYSGLVEAALDELLGKDRRLLARKKDEHRVGGGVARALQERREIGICERHAQRLDDLAAGR